MTDAIRYAADGPIARITLDDGKVNAMSLPFFEALNAALDAAERDGAKTVILTGRSGMFSAGLNLKVLPTLGPDELRTTLRTFGRTMLRVFTFPIPIVAALGGHAIAGGAMLAYACDVRLMADGAFRLHLNESAIGLPLPTWAILIAQSAVPVRWQAEAILHARAYAPAEALERGLVERVVAPDRLLDEAAALAAPLAALDTGAYAESKRRLRAPATRWADERLEEELGAKFSGSR
jgi:enoyl-CoA hydratase/carnithine racemase